MDEALEIAAQISHEKSIRNERVRGERRDWYPRSLVEMHKRAKASEKPNNDMRYARFCEADQTQKLFKGLGLKVSVRPHGVPYKSMMSPPDTM